MRISAALALAVALGLLGCQPAREAGAPAPTAARPAPGVAATAAPTIAAVPTAPAALETVRVGTINNFTDAPFYMADEWGYLREQGLAQEIITFDSAQQMVAPLGSDQLDVGGGAPGTGLFNAIGRGVNVRIVADRARAVPGTRFNCLVVRKSLLDSGQLRGPADLRGRPLAENAARVLTTMALERELALGGLTLSDISYSVMPFPDMLVAFGNGAVDGAFLVEPFITLGEQRGISECWRPTSEIMPDLQIAVTLYGPTFAEQRTDTARRFMVAYLRAVRDYYRAFYGDGQGRDAILQLMARVTNTNLALLERVAPSWMDPNGQVSLDSLQSIQAWYLEKGEISGSLDLGRVVDPSFAGYAVERLGPYVER